MAEVNPVLKTQLAKKRQEATWQEARSTALAMIKDPETVAKALGIDPERVKKFGASAYTEQLTEQLLT